MQPTSVVQSPTEIDTGILEYEINHRPACKEALAKSKTRYFLTMM